MFLLNYLKNSSKLMTYNNRSIIFAKFLNTLFFKHVYNFNIAIRWKSSFDIKKKLSVITEMMLNKPYYEDEQPPDKILTEKSNLNSSKKPVSYDSKDSFSEIESFSKLKLRNLIYDFESSDLDENTLHKENDYITSNMKNDITQVALPNSGNKMISLYGTPDYNQPISNIPCFGCGANLHCKDPSIPGYLPSQKYLLLSPTQLNETLCQRCNLLRTKNVALNVELTSDKFYPISRVITKQSALIVLLVDLTDIENSFHRDFYYLLAKNRPMYIIGNKLDLLPKDKDGYLFSVYNSLIETAKKYGFSKENNVLLYRLISAKTGYGIEPLITHIFNDWSNKGQVYITGCTNAGKSTFFNLLINSDLCRSSARDVINKATTSIWPGTTLKLLKFPLTNPKPSKQYERMERLKKQKSTEKEEKKLQQTIKLHKQYNNIHGHIGCTYLTPTQVALKSQSEIDSSFLVPSYTYKQTDTQSLTSNSSKRILSTEKIEDENYKLEDNLEWKGVSDYLDLKPHKYKEENYKYWCYDTPGLINKQQIINMLNQSELGYLINLEPIKPRTFILKPTQVLFIAGLARVDYLKGKESALFTVFCNKRLPIYVINGHCADDFYEENIGSTAMGVPIGNKDRLNNLATLVGREFEIVGEGMDHSAADILLSSLGWVSVTAHSGDLVNARAFTPGAYGCLLRKPSLLKYAVTLRGPRIERSRMFKVL